MNIVSSNVTSCSSLIDSSFSSSTDEEDSLFTQAYPYRCLRNNNKQHIRLKRCGTICVKYIFDVPHVLLVRGKKSHIWSLPKGCINDGESEMACAVRETLEETGISVELNAESTRVVINHNVYFVVMIQHNPKLKIRDRSEIDKVNWMTLNEIRTLDCNKDLRSILQYPCRKFSFHYNLVDVLKLNELAPICHSPALIYTAPPGLSPTPKMLPLLSL